MVAILLPHASAMPFARRSAQSVLPPPLGAPGKTFNQIWRYTLLPVWIVTYKYKGAG